MEQKLHLLTYADELYEKAQAELVNHAASLGVFDSIKNAKREYLIQTDFYKDNKYILDKPKGGGYCCWKPWIILNILNEIKEGDVLLYMDSADWINSMADVYGAPYAYSFMKDEILTKMQNNDILLTAGAFPNKDWTKRDCFVGMMCDEEKYHNAIQIEAGVMLIKNTSKSREIVEEWLRYCKVSSIITEDENIFNLPNFSTFKEHRYDQSVMTNIGVRRGITPSGFIRKFITCNVNMPE
jgi:hypothetical protein